MKEKIHAITLSGELSASNFRDKVLVPALKANKYVNIHGVMSDMHTYTSTYLKDVFSKLTRLSGCTFDELKDRLHIVFTDANLVNKIWNYIENGESENLAVEKGKAMKDSIDLPVHSANGNILSFRDVHLLPALKEYKHVTVHLDYPHDPLGTFIEEAFTDLISLSDISYKELKEKLSIASKVDVRRIGDAWSYIKNGAPMVPAAPAKPSTNPKAAFGATKPDLALIPPTALAHEAMSFEDGARKYGAFNWRSSSVDLMTYIAAAKRHLDAFLDGQDFTSDSNVHNLGAVRACCGIMIDTLENGNAIDNRPPKGCADAVHARLKKQKEEEAKAR